MGEPEPEAADTMESVFPLESSNWRAELPRSVQGDSGSDGGWSEDSHGISLSYSPPRSDEGGLSEVDPE